MTMNISPEFASDFHDAQLAGDRHRALEVVLAALQEGATTMDVYTEIIEPAQFRVGREWAAGSLTVAGEHMATAITQHVMCAMQSPHSTYREPREAPRGRVVVTGVPGESHQIGAQIVADALETDGWDVRFLGTDAPQVDLVEAIATFDPDVVCISATMVENLTAVTALIDQVRSDAPRTCVLVGGGAFSCWDDLWKRCGADAVAGDVRHAVVVARGMVAPVS